MANDINDVMKGLDLQWNWKDDRLAGIAIAKENVWSRSARRRKQRRLENIPTNSDDMDIDEDNEEDTGDFIALGVKIALSPEGISIRWLQGLDYVLFESFCGMLKRSLTISD
jgi:U6 snRNA m6A methyltransferase